MKTTFLTALGALLVAAPLVVPVAASAAEGAKIPDISWSFEGPFGSYDRLQLQRGFEIFDNVCTNCHGLKYLSFRDLGDETGPAFPEKQVEAIAAKYQVVDPNTGETRPGKPADHFPANNSMKAPDLTLMAKAREGFEGPHGLGIAQLIHGIGGPEYIHALLNGFTGKSKEVAGQTLWVNKVYPAGVIRMPPPLQGHDVDYKVYGSVKGETYAPPEPTLDQETKDVAAFLMWAAEPKLVERKEAGIRNVVMLGVLAVLLYLTNKQIWASVKGKE